MRRDEDKLQLFSYLWVRFELVINFKHLFCDFWDRFSFNVWWDFVKVRVKSSVSEIRWRYVQLYTEAERRGDIFLFFWARSAMVGFVSVCNLWTRFNEEYFWVFYLVLTNSVWWAFHDDPFYVRFSSDWNLCAMILGTFSSNIEISKFFVY